MLATACAPDPFDEIEEAWAGRWTVLEQAEGEGCEASTPVERTWPQLELELPQVDGTSLSALGCRPSSCDDLPWLLIPLEEASTEALFGRSVSWTFFADEGTGSCEVQTGVVDATLADATMTLELRTFTGSFEAFGYEECESIAEDVVDDLCTQTTRYTAAR